MCGVARPKLRFLHVHARLERALTSAISCERYFHVFMKLAMMDENLKIQYAYDYMIAKGKLPLVRPEVFS